jgi:hypothetical protein
MAGNSKLICKLRGYSKLCTTSARYNKENSFGLGPIARKPTSGGGFSM